MPVEKVFIVMTGDGGDGNECEIQEVFATKEAAEAWMADANVGVRPDRSTYSMGMYIDAWPVRAK